MGADDDWRADTTNNMGDERSEAEGEIPVPVLEEIVLGLVGKEYDGCRRVGSTGEEQQGEECAD